MSAEPSMQWSLGWPRRDAFRRSIRLELALYAAGLFLALMTTAGYFITVRTVHNAQRAVAETLVLQARAFSGTAGKHLLASVAPDARLLNDICLKLAADNPDVYWAGISGPDQTFLAHTDFKQVMTGRRWAPSGAPTAQPFLRGGETFLQRGDTVFVTVAIDDNDVVLGRLALASSAQRIHAARNSAVATTVTVSLAIMLLGVPAALWLLDRKLRPVSVITESLKQVDLESWSPDILVESRDEFGYLSATLKVMGQRLKEAHQHFVERQRIAQELQIARAIQRSMLPKTFPQGERFSCAGDYRSALEVGGDYYDFIPLDRDRLGLVVADVSGKSLPGMLVMLMTRDIVKGAARSESDPARLLSITNRELRENIQKDMFVTMTYGVLDLETGVLEFASAGHNALLWARHEGDCQLLRPRGYPLGMMPEAVFDGRIERASVQLRPGDGLILYTDGVNEAQNGQAEEFGMDRLVETVGRQVRLEATEWVGQIMTSVELFVGAAPQYDDITLVALKWSGQTKWSPPSLRTERHVVRN